MAPAKVNLCLYLGPTRADGRHELVTVFESVSLFDQLTLTVLDDGSQDEVLCPDVSGSNLVDGALAGLRARGWAAPPVRIEIAKRIPVAAGMGGGSADAAAALRLAARVARLPVQAAQAVAAELGADVPSQLEPGLSLGTGAGEIVEQLAPLAPHAFVILPLPYELSTPAVYAEADRLGLPSDREAMRTRLTQLTGRLRHGATPPAQLLVNDLEPAARSLCPAIEPALAALRGAGAPHAFACGSGPTCAGLWWGEDADRAASTAASSLVPRFFGAMTVAPVSAIGHNSDQDR